MYVVRVLMLETTFVVDYVDPEEEGSKLHQNVDNHFPVNTGRYLTTAELSQH
jgi:hypothetical protein